MADTPALTDIQDSSFDTQAWVLSDKVNRNAAGALTGAKPEAQAGSKPTAEFANGVSAALRQVNQIFRGEEALGQPMVLSQEIYDIDFSTLANNTLSDGNETIDSNIWVVGNAAAATTFAVENGTGIHFDATTTSTQFTSTTVDCTRMRIALGTLMPTWSPFGKYLIETYFSSLTMGVSNNRVALSVYKDATTDAVLATGRRNVSGTQRIYAQTGTTITSSATVDAATSDCFAMYLDRAGITCLHGTYSSGFPALSAYTDGGYVPAPHIADFSLMSPSSYLIIAFVTGEAGGAMDAVLRRLRITRVG